MRAKRNLYRTQWARAFIHPSRRLSEQEIMSLEDLGFLPVQKELGETTRLVAFRVDTRTMNKIRILKHRMENLKNKKFETSEIIRLALLKGIKQMMHETLENQS
ncbi:MAG: hypothetical protein QHH15_02005 [Candidatus Thermoplasmatota archaeon]|jgi:hypothetical protein|nr:hypothetical protein [Candidatus Thermoplasmatota archaeon]